MNPIRTLPALLGLVLALPASSEAWVEVVLKSGRSIQADSMVDEGDRIRLYRKTGEMDIDRDSVRYIEEHEGVLHEGRRKARPARPAGPERAPVATASARTPEASAPAPSPWPSLDEVEPLEIPQHEDLAKVEQKLTRDLILENRDLLFARNRGDDPNEIQDRRVRIRRIQKTRMIVDERLAR